ncbi:MAG: DUF5321 domain-containing protein [Firmicutes bacterium]|nr:DUF5321 domain-containing protein [Bacillota bacterium]
MPNFDYEKILAAYHELQIAMARFIEEITPVIEEVMDKNQESNEKIHIAYLEAGTPYDESDLGLWKWITDIAQGFEDTATGGREAQERPDVEAFGTADAGQKEREWQEALRKIREEFEPKK